MKNQWTLPKMLKVPKTAIKMLLLSCGFMVILAHANLTQKDVHNFASAMSVAANQKNLQGVANLLDDGVLISLSRKGKTTTLDKAAYLDLLQNNWLKTQNYQYVIHVHDVVTTGNQAKATLETIETLTENGKPVKLITTSRVTFGSLSSGAVLLRAVSQLTIE